MTRRPLEWLAFFVVIMFSSVICYAIVAVIHHLATAGTADTPVELRDKMYELIDYMIGFVSGAVTMVLSFFLRSGNKDVTAQEK